jgi:carbon-monoxide dehydrogenase medium subunit
MVAVGPQGERTIKADDFFLDLLTTALAPSEILREIRIPVAKQGAGQAYLKMPQPASGFAVVGVAVNLERDQAGKCQSAGIGITGVASKAYRARAGEEAHKGSALDDAAIENAAALAADGIDANGDLYASAEYRRHLTNVFARRAIKAAASKV